MVRKYFDAHTHYAPEKGRESVYHCVNSVSQEDWDELIQLSHNRSDIIPFFGIHPWHVTTTNLGWEEKLRQSVLTVKESRPVGIGECGLDRSRNSFELQREICRTQFKIARDIGVPLSIHCVRAWSDLLELLKTIKMQDVPIMLHSFAGNKEIALLLQRWNVFFSIKLCKGNERGTDGSSSILEKAKATILFIPRERLLLESDSQSEVSSAHQPIERSYSLAAQLLDISEQECVEVIEENFNRYIRKP
jgi:TatD DNase family protein